LLKHTHLSIGKTFSAYKTGLARLPKQARLPSSHTQISC